MILLVIEHRLLNGVLEVTRLVQDLGIVDLGGAGDENWRLLDINWTSLGLSSSDLFCALKDLQVFESSLVLLEKDKLTNHADNEEGSDRAESEVMFLGGGIFGISLIIFDHPWSNLRKPVLLPLLTLLLSLVLSLFIIILRLVLILINEESPEAFLRLLLLRLRHLHIDIIVVLESLEIHHTIPSLLMVLEEAIVESLENSALFRSERFGQCNVFRFSDLLI